MIAETFPLAGGRDRFPSFGRILGTLLEQWPQHEKFIERSCLDRNTATMETTEHVASMIVALAGDDLSSLCADYRWTCDRLLDEAMEFRRSGRYRCATFAEVTSDVYSSPDFMGRYVNGLLVSQVLWANHAAVIDFYERSFLTTAKSGTRLLEVGPGHGLMLCLAAGDDRINELSGWDVSATSIATTRTALEKLDVRKPVELATRDILDPGSASDRFDAVVMSEVLEHLEHPDVALAAARRLMAPESRLFVNVPVNSPAPDHLYLLRTPDEALQLVERNAFKIVDARFFPMTGFTLERARKSAATISCAIIAKQG